VEPLSHRQQHGCYPRGGRHPAAGVALVCAGTDVHKEKVAGALASLSSDVGTKVAIRDAGGIPPLVALVESGTEMQALLTQVPC
jgi:hypothetical protein